MQLASQKRSFLALYLDTWLFAACFESGVSLLPHGSWLRPWYVALGLFVALELLLVYALQQTPGRAVLGMVKHGQQLLVHPAWRARERWWTIAIGVLGLMEGVKELTRWTQGLPPPPFMGLSLSWDQAAAVVTCTGLLTMAASLGVLACSPRAALLGVAITALGLLSWALSWSLIEPWVDARTLASRALRGVAVRPGELALMRKLLPGGAIFGELAGCLWLLASHRAFCRPRALS